MNELLQEIKAQKWFYEFELPDGSKTDCYIPPEVRQIHVTRAKALRQYLAERRAAFSTALDISCHEGFFSLMLAGYIASVTGVDRNAESLAKARRMVNLFGKKIALKEARVEDLDESSAADFVLCYGLLYHVENPIEIFRRLAQLTKKTLCIETQVLPFQIAAPIEDGSYKWQRSLQGMFGVCVDYSDRPEGGVTDVALIPSVDALRFMLDHLGFKKIDFYTPRADDYEQFVRGHRVIVTAER